MVSTRVVCQTWIVFACSLAGLPAMLSANENEAELNTASVEQLLQQLGDLSFDRREAAAEELVGRGQSVKPSVEQALRSPDLEIRLRAKQILARLERADLNARLEAFVKDTEGLHEHDLPSWKRFQAVVGNNAAARELFADMIRAESRLLAAFESNPKQATVDYVMRVQTLQTSAIPGLPQPTLPSTLATLLLIGSDPKIATDTSSGYQMYGFLTRNEAVDMIQQGSASVMFKKLLTEWIERSASNSSMARNGLLLAQRYELPEVGLKLGREMLSQKDSASYVLPYAVLFVGQFGNKDDAKLLEPLLTNETVCHSWHNSKFKDIVRIQVRDIALAVLIHLHGQQPQDFSYALLQKDPRGLFYVYTLGFAKDDDGEPEEKRAATFAKWDEWVKQQSAPESQTQDK